MVDVVCLFVCLILIFISLGFFFFFLAYTTWSSLTNVCLANVIKVVNLYECISTMSMVS